MLIMKKLVFYDSECYVKDLNGPNITPVPLFVTVMDVYVFDIIITSSAFEIIFSPFSLRSQENFCNFNFFSTISYAPLYAFFSKIGMGTKLRRS